VEPTTVYWALTEPLVREHGAFLTSLLDAGERSRAAAFRFAADRDAFVAAHALVRLALSAAGPGDPRDWTFAATAGGKPELAGTARGNGLTFSLSHARSIVACAVAHAVSAGVDVEEIPAQPLEPALIANCCTPAERELLRALPPAAAAAAFARLWTLKEAVMKALGTGLTLPPDAIACALEPPRILSGAGLDWDALALSPSPRHVLTAVQPAAAGAGWRVRDASACLPAPR
jgi:4'-phosphopantetheinyl transferase